MTLNAGARDTHFIVIERIAAGNNLLQVLFVTNEIPHYTGGGMLIRDFNLLQALADRHEFTVVCFGYSGEQQDERVEGLKSFCKSVVLVDYGQETQEHKVSRLTKVTKILQPTPQRVQSLSPAGMRRVVYELTRRNRFDIVHVNHVEMGPLLSGVEWAKRIIGIESIWPIVKRERDTLNSSLKRILYDLEWRKMKRYERTLYQSVDLCTMASPREKEVVHSLTPAARVAVIPNGVDISFFRNGHSISGNIDNKDGLLFIGSMAYWPNEDAVQFFYRDILPYIKERCGDIKWQIVGRDPSPAVRHLASERIEITGWVDDVRPYMWSSQVMIVPLRSGGGTRLKILEAMAAGIPVVSTTLGAEGLAVVHDKNILIADAAEEFAEAVVRLINQPQLVERITRNARKLVETVYDWSMIAEQLDEAYQSILQFGN
jgi:sugar transferase (PEP-CTERM/EpsH1 system associated)